MECEREESAFVGYVTVQVLYFLCFNDFLLCLLLFASKRPLKVSEIFNLLRKCAFCLYVIVQRIKLRGGQKWISARPYPAGFEKSGRVAKGRAGLPKWYCAGFCPPVSPYPPGFPIPAGFFKYPPGFSVPAGSTRSPAGRSGTRLPVAPVKS